MTKEDIETLRQALKSASPHYPGFENSAMQRNIDELCNLAIKGWKSEQLEEFIKKEDKRHGWLYKKLSNIE